MRSLSIKTRSPQETRILGVALAPMLVPGDVVSLSGDLGAGKTILVQGVASALGVHERVTSPTFTIVHEYRGRYPLMHVDLYRLNTVQEVFDLGFEELLDPSAILLVEWGDAVGPLLPPRFLDITLQRAPDAADENERLVMFTPRGDEWWLKLEGMRSTAETLLDAVSTDEGSVARFVDSPGPRPRDDRQRRELPGTEP